MLAIRPLAETQNCQSESEIGGEQPGYRGVDVHWECDAVRLQLLPRAQTLLWVFFCGGEIPFKFLDQVLQRKSGNLIERLPVRDFQRFLCGFRTKPVCQPLVVIMPRVVFPRGREINQPPQLARYSRQAAVRQVVVACWSGIRLTSAVTIHSSLYFLAHVTRLYDGPTPFISCGRRPASNSLATWPIRCVSAAAYTATTRTFCAPANPIPTNISAQAALSCAY